MTDETNDTHLAILRGMRRIFSPKELERITMRFEMRFHGLDLKSLPEYQAAIDAIKNYRNAAVAHFDSEYQKQISSE